MNRPKAWKVVVGLLVLAITAGWRVEASEYDDCDADLMAFVGANAYQFSPYALGQLSTVRLYSVLSYQRAAALGERGDVVRKLETPSLQNSRGPGENRTTQGPLLGGREEHVLDHQQRQPGHPWERGRTWLWGGLGY